MAGLGQPIFEMCWVYMAIAQIAQGPPLCQMDKRGKKSVPNHPGKPLHPRANLCEKMLQTIIASLFTSPELRKRGYILREGKPLFEMCWFYMVLYGHYPNRLSPLPPLCQMGKREKSVPNHPGKPLHPRAYIGKKKYSKPFGKPKTSPQY